MRFIDLFAGLGGFHLALEDLGHECVFASEIDDRLRDVYFANFGITPEGDIRKVKESQIPAHDILCAGFPCQSFSKAGAQKGLKDKERGALFYQILRIIKARKPKYILLENVPNIKRHDNGKTWQKIEQSLKDSGYYIDSKEYSPHHFGIPQIRLRTYIVGSRQPLDHFKWPEPKSTEVSISSILETNPEGAQPINDMMKRSLGIWQEFIEKIQSDDKVPHPVWAMEFGATYPYEHATPHAVNFRELSKYRGSFGMKLEGASKQKLMHQLPSHAQRKQRKFPEWKIAMIKRNREFYARNKKWIDEWKIKLKDFPSSYQKLEWNCQGNERDISKYLIQFRASGVRVKRLTTAPSLVAMTSTQVPIVSWEERYMTHGECKKLQSMERLNHLPESNSRAYEALGNAVNVEVAKTVARSLLENEQAVR
ncbi:MAG: DNA cytosine methyltransferase [Candidatus Marsarchaeota archaeon]|nr:DNA cytosine methyltransferase [Candidatus Marsarchaeota archaeon]